MPLQLQTYKAKAKFWASYQFIQTYTNDHRDNLHLKFEVSGECEYLANADE